MSAPRRLDLRRLIERVFAGETSVAAAVQHVEGHAAVYRVPDPDDHAGIDAWIDAQDDLRETVSKLALALADESSPVRLLDQAAILFAAAGLGSPGYQRRVGGVLASLLAERGGCEAALGYLARMRELEEEAEPDVALFNASAEYDCRSELNQYPELEAAATEVHRAALAVGRRGKAAGALLGRARARGELGRHAEALADAREALRLRLSLSDEEVRSDEAIPVSRHYLRIAELARDAGRFDDALEALEEGRAQARREGDAGFAAFLLSEIGYTWQGAGDIERGAEVLEAAAREADAAGDPVAAARWRQVLPPQEREGEESVGALLARGIALLRAGKEPAAAAREILLRCIAAAVAQRNQGVEPYARGALAEAYLKDGRVYQAEIALREAIRAAARAGDAGAELNLRLNLGNLFGMRSRMEEAVAELHAAVRLGETLREGHTTELRQTLGAALSRAYEQLAFFHSVSYRPHDGAEFRPPAAEERLRIGQKTRAVNLARWLSFGEVVEESGDPELLRRLLELRAAEVAIEAGAEEMDMPLAALRAARAAAERHLAAECRARGVALPAAPPECDLAGVRSLLADGECVLDLLSHEEGISFVLVPASAPPVVTFRPWPRRARVDVLRRWCLELRERGRAETMRGADMPAWRSLDRDPPPGDGGGAARGLEALTDELERYLVEPIGRLLADHAPVRRVIIAAHRDLFQAPFWLLTERVPGLTLSLVPGLNVAGQLARRRRSGEEPWVACGDVTGTLPHAPGEMRLLPGFRPCAPRTGAMLRSWTDAGLVHFAGHGHFDARNPYRSGIVVARGEAGESDPLGAPDPWGLGCELLTVAQLVGRLHLSHCRLAVLSGCYTGLPRIHPASEFTSLPAALFTAGARNVVAALWPVHDGAAAILMQEFYAALTAEGAGGSPSAALARGRSRLAAMPRDEVVRRLGSEDHVPERDRPFSAPIYTDAFQHYGID